MLDIMTLTGNQQPHNWIFSDLEGRIQVIDVRQLGIPDIINAFLSNLRTEKTLPASKQQIVVIYIYIYT